MPSTTGTIILCLLKLQLILTEKYILKTQCWRMDAAEGCKWKTKGFYQKKTLINKKPKQKALKDSVWKKALSRGKELAMKRE